MTSHMLAALWAEAFTRHPYTTVAMDEALPSQLLRDASVLDGHAMMLLPTAPPALADLLDRLRTALAPALALYSALAAWMARCPEPAAAIPHEMHWPRRAELLARMREAAAEVRTVTDALRDQR